MTQERKYDPLLQRWRDDALEAKQAAFEEKERVAYLNRALDVQILREHPHHVTSHESRIEPLVNKAHTGPTDILDPTSFSMPQTCVDYNIISNLSLEVHHPCKPEVRPRAHERDPKVRKKQAAQLRDFNVVNNRYLVDHEAKSSRDAKLNALLATEKYRERNRFDPLAQKYNERDVEERHRCCDDAREVEIRLRAEKKQPQCYRERVSEHYDMITHRADDQGTLQLKLLDTIEQQRKSRYKHKYIDEDARKRYNFEFEDTDARQRNERCGHERWEEITRRGYDIVNNRAYGNGPHLQKLHEPHTTPRLTTWEMVELNRSGTTPCATPRVSDKNDTRKPLITTPEVLQVFDKDDARKPMISTQEVLESARIDRSHDATPSSERRTPRKQSTPRVLSDAGSASIAIARSRNTPRVLSDAGSTSIASARGRPPLIASSEKVTQASGPPPPPAIPGSPVGSVYSKPKL
jgi:hypothetical protein